MGADFLRSLAGLNLPPELQKQLEALQPAALPHRDVLLNRLSLPRTFNERIFSAAARQLPSPKPAFADFTALPEVQPLIGYPGRFTIDEKVRGQHFRGGSVQTEEWRTWGFECAGLLDADDEIESLDRLQILFFVDPSNARDELQKAFDGADTGNDIPRCGALVQLIASVVPVIRDDKVEGLFRTLQARYRSRSLFYTEFLQTADFFARTAMEEKLDTFVQSKDFAHWVFHLHATGGMGKTTLLRRMISRKWIVQSHRCPCAWIDFDYLDVSAILQAPWLLALPIAAQWNEQLDAPVFGGLLNPSMQPLSALLFRARADGSARGLSSATANDLSRDQYRAGRSNPMRCGMLAGAIPPETVDQRRQLLDSARSQRFVLYDKFPQAVAEFPPDRPALIFLDTLEEASLQHSQDLRETLVLIQEMRERVLEHCKQTGRPPINIKMILSGRHELGKQGHVPEFPADFLNQYDSYPLAGFDPPEAGDFLEDRLPEKQYHLIPAMVSKSEGVPFNLSLFAEWAKDDPNLEEKTVLESEEITTVMLIERIVKRIPYQPLRWIIRYGAVPRALTESFLNDVMRQPLIDALSGKARAEGLDNPGSSLEQDVWSEEKDFHFDAAKLWQDHVLRYASVKGWMEPSGDAVRFRSDVQNPMRQLLRRQRIFRDLHRLARDWFGRRSQNPAHWLAARTEWLYHSLQLRGVAPEEAGDLLPELRKLLDSALLAGDAALRRETAKAILSADFAGWNPAERAYLEYRLAEAMAAEAGYRYMGEETKRVLRSAFETAGAEHASTLPPFADEWNRAAQSTPISALAPRMDAIPPDDAVQLAMLIAEIGGTQSSVTPDVLHKALKIPSSIVPIGYVRERLAAYQAVNSPEAAIPHYKAAAEDFQSRGLKSRRSDLLAARASIELAMGRLSAAERTIRPSGEPLLRTTAVTLQLAREELVRRQPSRALDLLGRIDASRLPPSDQLEVAILSAEGLTQHMLWSGAQEQWERARGLASAISDQVAMSRCVEGLVRLNCWWLRRTERPPVVSLIDSIATPSAELNVWRIVLSDDLDTLRRWAHAQSQEGDAAARVRRSLALSKVGVPEWRWRELLDLAKRMTSSVRLGALAEPVLMGDPPAEKDLPPELRRSLADAFRHIPEGPVEEGWYAIRYGEFLAWLGFYREAADLLARNVSSDNFTSEAWRAAAYRERRRIEQRMRNWGFRDVDPDPEPAKIWWSFWHHTPFRRAAVTIENAWRAFDAGKGDLAEECLALATPVLQETPFATEFQQSSRRLRDALSPEKTHTVLEALGPRISPYSILLLRPQAGRLSARIGGELSTDALISTDSPVLETLLRSRGIPRRLVGIVHGELGRELRDVLEQAGVDSKGHRRIGLRMPLGALSAAPWEMGMEGSLRPFRIRSGDDYDFEIPMKLVETQHDIQPAMIFPLSPSDKESPSIQPYFDLANRLKAGSSLDVLGQQDPISIIYIASCFEEIPSLAEPVIAGLQTTPAMLSQQLERYAGRMRPAVILDVPAVRTASDHLHQLFLRNYFAQALLDTGTVFCVLAIGLQNPKTTGHIHQILMDEFRKPQKNQVDLLDHISRFHIQGLRDEALFTRRPHGYLCGEERRYA